MDGQARCIRCGAYMGPAGCPYCNLMGSIQRPQQQQNYDRPSTYSQGGGYTEQVGEAGGSLLARVVSATTAAIGYKAYKNNYDINEDHVESAWQGAKAARRWFTWILLFLFWLFCMCGFAFAFYLSSRPDWLVFGDGAGPHTMAFGFFTLGAIFPFAFGVTWCRNINVALFRRGRIYRLFAPLANHLEWCPAWALYGLIVIPLLPLPV